MRFPLSTAVLATEDAAAHRRQWLERIATNSGDFQMAVSRLQQDIESEALDCTLNHIRLCGVIPENLAHDSSHEKLYSKYTDIVIHKAYSLLGFASTVLSGRAGMADVECTGNDYDFVADAKSFRLSRTAKNQKDFKISAIDTWKHGKLYAMVVCPLYQLPSRSSQIYLQAATRSVCIFSYTHLAVLVVCGDQIGNEFSQMLLHQVFEAVKDMAPTKSAYTYWSTINRVMLGVERRIVEPIWCAEKAVLAETLRLHRLEAEQYIVQEKKDVMQMSRKEALQEVLSRRKLDGRLRIVRSVKDNGLMNMTGESNERVE